jgi:hypothetical protein
MKINIFSLIHLLKRNLTSRMRVLEYYLNNYSQPFFISLNFWNDRWFNNCESWSSPVKKVWHLRSHKIAQVPFSHQQFLVSSWIKACKSEIEKNLVRNTLIMEMVQHFTPLMHLNEVNYLQSFCSAIRNLPSLILIRKSPRSFRNVTVHAFKVPGRVVPDLYNF